METDIIIYSPLIISLFSFLSLFISGWKKDESKLILSYFMLFGSAFFAIFIIRYSGNLLVYSYLHIAFISLLLISCPLLYLYFYSLTVFKGYDKLVILHFLPTFIALYFGSLLYFSLNHEERLYFIKNQDYMVLSKNLHYKILYLLLGFFEYLFFGQLIFYYIKAKIILHKHSQALNSLFSDNFGLELNWVKVFLKFLAIWAVISMVANIFLTNRIHLLFHISLIITFFQSILLASLYVLASTQKQLPVLSHMSDMQHNHFKYHQLREKLLTTFEEKKLYLKKDLTIWDVCRETNSNRTYISNLINEEFGMNFNSFVNKYRIEKAINMLNNKNHNQKTLDEIAKLSGFNSLTSFNRVFKKSTNLSPGNYRIFNKENLP